jgi:general secretion pathway protein L
MSWPIPHLLSSDASELALSAWRWWLDELRATVPDSIKRLVLTRAGTIVIDVREDAISVQYLGPRQHIQMAQILVKDLSLKRSLSGGLTRLQGVLDQVNDVVVRLRSDQVLRKTINLPLASARNLRPILVNEIDRQTPLGSTAVVFDFRVLAKHRESNELSVELAIVKRETIEGILHTVRRIGLEPTVIGIADASADGARYNFLPAHAPSRATRMQRRVVASLAGISMVLAMALLAAWFWQGQIDADSLAAALSKAKTESQAVEKLRKDVTALTDKTEFLPRQREQPSTARVLNEISHILPDGTWLFQLEVSGREVRLRGYSDVSPTLIALLDGSSLFANAQFRAPLTRGPRVDLERFDISVQLREAQAP